MKWRSTCQLLFLIFTCVLILGCGGSTSGGSNILGVFTVEGRWTGTMSNRGGTRSIPVSMTLIDTAGTVTGSILTPEYECVTSGKLTGTSKQSEPGGPGDNIATPGFNEAGDTGTLTMDWDPQPQEGGSPARVSQMVVVLTGSTTKLTGHYIGHWNLEANTPAAELCGGDSNAPTRQTEGVMTITKS